MKTSMPYSEAFMTLVRQVETRLPEQATLSQADTVEDMQVRGINRRLEGRKIRRESDWTR